MIFLPAYYVSNAETVCFLVSERNFQVALPVCSGWPNITVPLCPASSGRSLSVFRTQTCGSRQLRVSATVVACRRIDDNGNAAKLRPSLLVPISLHWGSFIFASGRLMFFLYRQTYSCVIAQKKEVTCLICWWCTINYNCYVCSSFPQRDGWRHQNRWIFGKVPNGLWPPQPTTYFWKIILHLFFF